MIAFRRVVPGTRKVEFVVNSKIVTRRLPKQFAGTTDEMIASIARGLNIEAVAGDLKADDGTKVAAGPVARNVEAEVTIAPNEVLVPDSVLP